MGYLSYSGWKKYHDCQRAYWHSYINKTQPPDPDNRVGMLFGSVTGTVFEHFYNDRVWKQSRPLKTLLDMVEPITHTTMRKEKSKGGIFNWKDPKFKKGSPKSVEDLIRQVKDVLPNGLNIIRQHRLLGADAVAEKKLDSGFNGHIVGGRCDFIMKRIRPLSDLVILDGKGSLYRDKYVDPRQLYWYAMLHRKLAGQLPDQLAFIYWRSEPSEAVDWFTPTMAIVDELQDTVLRTISDIDAKRAQSSEVFPARPSVDNCRFCPYVFTCPEGQAMNQNPPAISPAIGVEDVTLE